METDPAKKLLIQKLIELLQLMHAHSEITNVGQITFISETIVVVLHAAQEPVTAHLLQKYIDKYIAEFGLMTNQITMPQFLHKEVPLTAN